MTEFKEFVRFDDARIALRRGYGVGGAVTDNEY